MEPLIYRTVVFQVLLAIFLLSIASHVTAQPVLSHQTISMGGGTSYITGPAANFYNPANLMIRDNRRRNKLILAQGGFYLSEGIELGNLKQDYASFGDYFTNYNSPESGGEYSKSEILQRRFPDENSLFSNSARFDVISFGISFTREQNAYSLALRSRSTNSFEINRGWYDDSFHGNGSGEELERTLRQNLQTYHELSFGFAREVSMVNGWIPGLNRLYFGIAPKLIVGGMFFNGDYSSTYFREQGDGDIQYTRQYSTKSVADNATADPSKLDDDSSDNLFMDQITNYGQTFFKTTGLGIGIDAGFTFVVNLDNDNSFSTDLKDKSLRLSISMTDIGFVSYNEQPSVFQSLSHTKEAVSDPGNVQQNFKGRIGEFSDFISNNSGDTESLDLGTSVEKRFNDMLPAALHLGAALQYNRFLTAVDLEYQLSPVRFDQEGWYTRVGTEFRLLKFLPIRSGISLNPSMETILGLGTGIDAGVWELSLATKIKQGYNNKAYTIGLAVAALQFRF